MKARRQAAILELVEREDITSQEQLRQRLKERGFEATQATLSRDIRDLALVKRAADGAYSTPGATETDRLDAVAVLDQAVAEFLRFIEPVQQLVVMKTDVGRAQPLALAIDNADVPEIVGTIGGDDTILVICRSPEEAAALVARLRQTAGL
jgi:transcriptional regulator of arginine metabolism